MLRGMSFVLLGDTHGNSAWTVSVVRAVAERGVSHIVQLGDFGYWPEMLDGREFLDSVEAALAEYDVRLWFIDGNHEDHERLSALPIDGETGRRPVSEHIEHLPRGYRWKVDGATWVAAGGAVSLDRAYRAEGTSWFPGEELGEGEVDAIVSEGPADVLVAHDAPFGVPFLYGRYRQSLPAHQRAAGWPVSALIDSDNHQQRILRLVEGLGVRQVFHGHHHVGYSDVLTVAGSSVDVRGLGADGDDAALWWPVDQGETPTR